MPDAKESRVQCQVHWTSKQQEACQVLRFMEIEEISEHLQIFALDPDNLGERKIQTSVPNPHISVLLLNFVQGKGLLLLLIAKRTRQKHLMIKIFVLSYVD